MEPFEKYSPKRIQKDVAPDALDDGGNRRFGTGDLIDALNCRHQGSGSDGLLKSVKGNVLKALSLNTGQNKVIGTFKNEPVNTVIYLIWNSNNVDRVVEYALDTNIFTILLEGDLKLEKEYMAQGGVIDDILLWNDRLNRPRSISLTKARSAGYTAPYSEYEISLATRPPLIEPTVVKGTDGTLPFNNLTNSTWQITHRYVYHDNRVSTVGPYSKLIWIRPFLDVNTATNNKLTVTIPFPVELAGIVTRIEVIAREANSNNFFIFDEIKNPTLSSYNVDFNNFGKKTILPIDEATRLYDYIPDRTEGFEVLRDRVFSILNKTGFDVDESTFDITVTLKSEVAPGPTLPAAPYNTNPIPNNATNRDGSYNNKMYLKAGGHYVVAIIFEDEFGKTSFAKKQKRIVVPFDHRLGYPGSRHYVECALSGTPPPRVVAYKFVISEELFYENYFQARLYPLVYYREIATGENDNTQEINGFIKGLYSWKGKVFYDVFNELTRPGDIDTIGIKYLYWQLPVNVPFVPDSTYFIRFTTDVATTFIPVLGVVGGYLVTEFEKFKLLFHSNSINVDVEPHYASQVWNGGAMAEVFKMKASSSPTRFFETGNTYQITGGVFTTTIVNIYGDTYNLRVLFEAEYLYDWVTLLVDQDANHFGVHSSAYKDVSTFKREKIFIESPSGLFSATAAIPITTEAGRVDSTVTDAGTSNAFFYKSSLDYTKIASDHGRVHTVFDQEKQRDLFNVVGFSNTYVQNTFINGLNTFLAESQYPLPVERSRTRALKRAGDVMVAIHQTNASTLYIGEGFIRQNNDFILAKTDGVVGDDRKLKGGLGTINPESILEVFDDLFWWDGLKGAVVHYTLAGAFPISNYGMRNYFFRKAKELFPYRDSIKVVTGFDYAYDEFLITFPDVATTSGTIPGVTWAFNVLKNEWRTRYSFIPDLYASINLSLISFKDGALWVHDQNSLHNNFYGIQYTRKFRFAANPALGKNKRWLNVHIKMAGNSTPALDMTSEFAPVRIYNALGQESLIPAYQFGIEEGKWVGEILKDLNTSGIVSPAIPLRSGDDIVSDYLEVEVENDRLDEAPCVHVNVVFKTEEFSV
jgi:hypothetical protein